MMTNAGVAVRKEEVLLTAMGVQTGVATMDVNVEFPQKARKRSFILRHIPIRICILPQRYSSAFIGIVLTIASK